jgi:hypothetical protein
MKKKLSIDWGLVSFLLVLFGSMAGSWFYATSGHTLGNNFSQDLVVGFFVLFFGVGIVIQIIEKINDSAPKGTYTSKEWIKKVDSLNLN